MRVCRSTGVFASLSCGCDCHATNTRATVVHGFQVNVPTKVEVVFNGLVVRKTTNVVATAGLLQQPVSWRAKNEKGPTASSRLFILSQV